MPTTDYITAEELKQSLELAGTTFADSDIDRAIGAASRAIDGFCNRRFYVDTADAVRYYTLAASLIAIDDLSATPTEVAAATSAGTYNVVGVSGTDYDLEPLNAAADTRPFTVFRAINWWPSYKWSYSRIRGNIRITGKFGWPAVPEQVPQATGILAAKLLIRIRQAPFGIVTAGGDIGVAMRIARQDPDVAALLSDLVRDDLVF